MAKGPKPAPRTHIYLPELRAWKLQLTKGKYALVDEDDFEAVKDYVWFAHETSTGTYARREVHGDGTRYRVYLHREIMNAPKGSQIDHANYDTLDNRKCNLRIADKQRNMQNCRKRCGGKKTSSKYKGVSWAKECSRWHAYINPPNQKRINLGWFKEEIDAARAYNEAAKKHFGEYALLNELGV